jgi:RNA polymerase sigma-70 factor (TIGR02957 family)
MDDDTRTFDHLRPRLQGIAYRMLGSVAEAEEVVQDAWLRWNEARAMLDNTEAWLVTVTTRLAIDRLRAAKVQREHYFGIWLPEPQISDEPTPEQMVERADDVSVAFLSLLERLTPEARAAYLMREIFDADYDEVARTIGKSEAACRQLVHRAKAQLQDERPRHVVPAATHLQLMQRFTAALSSGDISSLKAMFVEDAELLGDGGGKVPSFGQPLLGGERVADVFIGARERYGSGHRVELALINGQWGVLRFIDGALESAQSFETDGSRIVRVHVQRNPDKLARIVASLKL